ncbi:hypothetical protein PR048_030852 [Dryococelus australis]|uniref:Cysteine and histidine-rich domain-containing protein 1 n=1 Tax=Dryococelus australis TaxID=614101 RepID=A0ABQ9GA39_9NEOP|nr:hypothetical protein PR048_030852 [Dryococelus australis]
MVGPHDPCLGSVVLGELASNVKPPEPVKPAVDESKVSEVIKVKAPARPTPEPLERPSFDTPLHQLQPVISSVLQQQLENLVLSSRTQEDVAEDGAIPSGTNCKNNSCKARLYLYTEWTVWVADWAQSTGLVMGLLMGLGKEQSDVFGSLWRVQSPRSRGSVVAAVVLASVQQGLQLVEIPTRESSGICGCTSGRTPQWQPPALYSYEGPDSDRGSCKYHPGCPVFHEGLKFWSCCQRRTTDFNTFLEQEGCTIGSHVWIKKKTSDERQQVNCRYDWHQTGSLVVLSVFAKKYDPAESWVKLNPVRLRLHLFFPEEQGCFDLDLELRGVVDVVGSTLSMLPTKVEVILRKAELGSWSKLDFPRLVAATQHPATPAPTPQVSVQDDLVDLSDL